MDFGSFDMSAAAQDVVTAASQGPLSGPIKDYNRFMDRVGAALSPTRQLLGTFTKQNVLKKLAARADPVFAHDWIGFVMDNGLSTSAQMPWEYIDGITLPAVTIESRSLFRNGTMRKTAGNMTNSTAELMFYTDRSGLAFNYADYWLRSTFRQDGFHNLPAKYKKDIVVFILDAKRKIVVDFRLVGCWPTSDNALSLGGAGVNMLQRTLTLEVDEVFVNYDSDLSSAKASIDGLFQSVAGNRTTVNAMSAAGQSTVNRLIGG